MNNTCDLYVYSDVNGGYTCHVAGSKRVSDTPCPEMPERWWESSPEEMVKIMAERQKWVDESKLVPIDLPHDGASFYCQDRDTMVETLTMLKAEGYTMPEDLIETIANEDEDD